MSRVSLDYNAAHKFVERNRAARWDGWDILLFTPTHFGFSNPDGAFVNGKWGMQVRVKPDANGIWNVNHKAVR